MKAETGSGGIMKTGGDAGRIVLAFVMMLLCLCAGLILTGCGEEAADETITGEEWNARAEAPAEEEGETGYFREHLDAGTAKVYDVIMDAVKHAGEEDYSKTIKFEPEYLKHRDLGDMYLLARMSIQNDHPELFWLDDNEIWEECVKMYKVSDGTAKAVVHFTSAPDPDELARFQQATEDFMKDIDLSRPQNEIALQIHDKLIDMVTYDEEAYERLVNSQTGGNSGETGEAEEESSGGTEESGDSEEVVGGDEATSGERAFTAYGALVANSAGQEHRAVCQGYALAYQHLLEEAGIRAMVVSGNAEDDDKENIGSTGDYGHAWNIVSLDGQWYETDPTWDDYEFDEEKMEEDSTFREFVQGAMEDPAYEAARHTYYNRTTEEMEDLVVGDEVTSHVPGYLPSELRSVGDHSSHLRYTVEEDETNWTLMDLLPKAEGTAYAW